MGVLRDNCTVHLSQCNRQGAGVSSQLVNQSQSVTVTRSTVTETELPDDTSAVVAVAYSPVPATILLQPAISVQHYIAVVRVSLEDESGSPASKPEQRIEPVSAARNDFESLSRRAPGELRITHEAAWQRVWSGRIEVSGNRTARAVARAINSSLFYIYSSMRADWPLGASPGGLANNACKGVRMIVYSLLAALL